MRAHPRTLASIRSSAKGGAEKISFVVAGQRVPLFAWEKHLLVCARNRYLGQRSVRIRAMDDGMR